MVTREEQKVIKREGHKVYSPIRERAARIPSSKPKPKESPKPRGRPLGWRKHEGEPEPRTTIQVYKSFKEMLDLERKDGETNADTVRRLYSDLKKEIRMLNGGIK